MSKTSGVPKWYTLPYKARARDSNDNPHISYYDGINENLKYAYARKPAPVGGFWVPVNKTELLAPSIILSSLIAVTTASVLYSKYRKRNQR